MSAHTPGPWIASDVLAPRDARVMVWQYNGRSDYYHNGKPIAECGFSTHAELRRGEVGCNQLEAEANARLIAAAPDLLKALVGLLRECNRHGCFENVSFEHPMVKPFFDAARAAVAKATIT